MKTPAGCAHLNTEPYVQPSASVMWSATTSQSSSEWPLGAEAIVTGLPSAVLHCKRSSSAGACLYGKHLSADCELKAHCKSAS